MKASFRDSSAIWANIPLKGLQKYKFPFSLQLFLIKNYIFIALHSFYKKDLN
jgi:hypothetical protein